MFIVRCLDVDHIYLSIQLVGNGVRQVAVKELMLFQMIAGVIVLNVIADFAPALILNAGLDFQLDIVDQGDIMKHGVSVFGNEYTGIEGGETT